MVLGGMPVVTPLDSSAWLFLRCMLVIIFPFIGQVSASDCVSKAGAKAIGGACPDANAVHMLQRGAFVVQTALGNGKSIEPSMYSNGEMRANVECVDVTDISENITNGGDPCPVYQPDPDPIVVVDADSNSVTFTVTQTWKNGAISWIAVDYPAGPTNPGQVCNKTETVSYIESSQYTATCTDNEAIVDVYVHDGSFQNPDPLRDITNEIPGRCNPSQDAYKKCRKQFKISCQCSATSTTSTPECDGSCEVYGDPHISGFDNLEDAGPSTLMRSISLASWQATTHSRGTTFDGRPMNVNAYEDGLVWLVRSSDIQIQGRFIYSAEFTPDRSALGALAVGGSFMNGSALIVEPLDGHVTWDGRSLDGGTNTVGRLESVIGPVRILWQALEVPSEGAGMAPMRMDAHLPRSLVLNVVRFDRHLDVKITMPRVSGAIEGYCGNYNGNDMDDGELNLNSRMNNLNVSVGESMFVSDTRHVPHLVHVASKI